MRRWTKALLFSVAVGSLPREAEAQFSSKSFDVCGGSFPGSSLLGFCAAADVAVSIINHQPTVQINIWNLSGGQATWDKSIPWTILMAVGLTNVIPQSVSVVNNSLKVTGPCAANPAGCDYSQYWWLGNNVGIGSLVIDMFAMDAVGGGIASTCNPNNPFVNRAPFLHTACDRNSSSFVTLSFGVSQYFDLANGGELFFKGNLNGDRATCVTGSSCVPITAAPEPGTLALLGSGLASFGGFGVFRRRRKREQDA